MWSFNYLYSFGKGQPNPKSVKIEFDENEAHQKTRCDVFTDWFKWLATYPMTLTQGFWNLFFLAVHREFHAPTIMNIYSGNKINCMPIPGKATFHIVSSPSIMKEIVRFHRNDPLGPFQGKRASAILMPLLKDLFYVDAKDDDFLLTCFKAVTESYRKPILDMIGPKNAKWIQSQLEVVIADVMRFLEKKEVMGIIAISAAEITEMFTVAVIARALFGYSLSEKAYQKIEHELKTLVNYQLLLEKPFGPSKAATNKYQSALDSIRETIQNSKKGPFNDLLQNTELSDIRQKGLILLLYIGGSEPPSSLLQYMLWRLGQNKQYQKAILQEFKSQSSPTFWQRRPIMEAFIAECLRMFAPGDNFSRFARKDLNIKFYGEKKEQIYNYHIPKGEGILCSPYLAARDPDQFPNPHQFDPSRFNPEEKEAKPFNQFNKWKPFSQNIHACPGKTLAMKEFLSLPTEILKTYEIQSSPPKDELAFRGLPTTKEIADKDQVMLILINRKGLSNDSKVEPSLKTHGMCVC